MVAAVETHAREATGATAVAAAILDERGRLRLLTPRAPGEKRVARRPEPMPSDRPLAEAARRGETVARQGDDTHPGAIVAVPLIADGAPLGALELQLDGADAIDGDDQTFLQTLANLCAQALTRGASSTASAKRGRWPRRSIPVSGDLRAGGDRHGPRPPRRPLAARQSAALPDAGVRTGRIAAVDLFRRHRSRRSGDNANLHARLLRGEIDNAVMEKRMRRKDGATVWVSVTSAVVRDAAGQPAYTIAALEDISRRKADEAERERLLAQFAAERARLETVLQQLPVGVVIADAASGKIVMANRQVDAALDGTSRPDDTLARAIRSGETVTADEYPVRRADGSVGLVRSSAAPVRDRDGRIIAGVMTIEDITSRRRDETAQRLLAAAGELLAERVNDPAALEDLARLTLPEFADACLIEIDGRDGSERSLVAAAVEPEREAAWRSADWSCAAAITASGSICRAHARRAASADRRRRQPAGAGGVVRLAAARSDAGGAVDDPRRRQWRARRF